MAAISVPVGAISSIDPATGQVLQYFEATPPEQLPEIVARARKIQKNWVEIPVVARRAQIRKLGEVMLASRDILANAVVAESGKPRVEALFADVFVALDTADY